MNNTVGYAPLHQFGSRAALGTDGFTADMFEESRYGFYRNCEAGKKLPPAHFAQLLSGGQALVSEIFGEDVGTLRADAIADLIVLDYTPPTPLTNGNLLSHALFGMRSAAVESVMVDGRWVVWEGRLVNISEEQVLHRARRIAKDLWARMYDR